jgi:molybdate transport system substrate-binding protein
MRSIIVAFVLLYSVPLQAAEIKVLTTGFFRGVFPTLIPKFELNSGHKVVLATETPGVVKEKLLKGDSPDVVFAVDNMMKDIEQGGKIIEDSRTKIGQVYIAAVIRTGAPKLDLSTPDAVKRAILAAKAVAINDPKGGSYIGRFVMGLADRFAFDDQLRSRLKLFPGGGDQVSEAVLRGDADFGITISSEIAAVKGVEISSPLPPEMNNVIVAYGFLLSGTQQAEAGKALIKFMISPEAKSLLKTKGIEPS